MGSTMNGMALYGSVIPFGGTFQTFSDYMRPAIRLAALSHIQTIFVFTHDSIGLGEDGPTHQSVEHLAALRAIPNLALIRPCDAHEVREAWRAALETQQRADGFCAFAAKSRADRPQEIRRCERPAQRRYVLAEAETKTGKAAAPKLILIATGSEVGLAMEAREKLNADGTRRASSRCRAGNFLTRKRQNTKNRSSAANVKARLAIEAGVSLGWANMSATGRHAYASTASARRPRPKMCSAITGLRSRMWSRRRRICYV